MALHACTDYENIFLTTLVTGSQRKSIPVPGLADIKNGRRPLFFVHVYVRKSSYDLLSKVVL